VTSTISTAVTAGAAQSVSLSASGVPAGVTATFSPASVTAGSSSTLSLTAAAGATTGTFAIAVTGTGASASHSTTINLTVTAAGTTVLRNNVPVTGLSGAAGAQQFFQLDVPAAATGLVFTISGGTGDADLYVRFGSPPTTSTFDCRPFLGGNNETCSIASAQAGTYFVMVRGFAAFTGVTLTGRFNVMATLQNGVPITGISGAAGSNQSWSLAGVPAGATVTIRITPGTGSTGDADLYVRRGVAPTTSTFDCRPFLNGNTETCMLTNSTAASADYFILINGFAAFTNVTLSGSF
jgi:serine protease